MTDYAVNIMAVYKRSTVADISEGMEWYARARDIATEAGCVIRGAGIIAALSPRVRWDRNVMLARMAFESPLGSVALGGSVVKANAIREGAHPLDVLGGSKTRSFFQNILDPSDPWPVTVDTHAIKVAGLDRDAVGVRMYADISAGYREVADYVGILPQQAQAVTWITWRREHEGIRRPRAA